MVRNPVYDYGQFDQEYAELPQPSEFEMGVAYPTNQFGRSVEITPTTAIGSKQTVLDLSERDIKGRPVTVCLAKAILPPAFATSARLRALVEWGIGGVQTSAEVDWRQGTLFTLCASFLRVSVINDALPGSTFKAGAFAGFLNQSNGMRRATRTVYVDLGILAAANQDIAVPPYAETFSFQRTTMVEFRARFLNTLGTEQYRIDVGAGEYMPPVVLGNDIATVNIVNLSGATNINVGEGIFELSL